MHCPKDRKVELSYGCLTDHLPVQSCPDCKGTWIPAENYEAWQRQQQPATLVDLPKILDVDYVQSPFDVKAALCPECRHYLTRAKVGIAHPFYVERCPHCSGIWCDYGEWEALEQLGLTAMIQQLFTSEWQERSKEREQALRERQATIEKLGDELAHRLFELAEQLEHHPNGDFGMAYLMRRFGK